MTRGQSLRDLRDDVRRFIAPHRDRWSTAVDSWHLGFDRSFSAALVEKGWVGMTIPARYGGAERSALERFVVIEELLRAGAPVAAHWVGDRQTAPLLLKLGTEAQRERYLPKIARAEATFVIGMSEPEAGSDLAALRARARPVSGGWELTGTKIWTTHAHLADHVMVLCRTAEAERRHDGMSQMIVDLRAPGVEVNQIATMSGHASFCEVVFDEVFVPEDDLIGQAGDGWRQVMLELGFERAGPERFLSTFPLFDRLAGLLKGRSAYAEMEVGALAAELSAFHLLAFETARRQAAGEEPSVGASVGKEAGPRFEQELVERVAKLLAIESPEGADGGLRSMIDAARLLAPSFTIRGGTTEVMRTVIAREVLRG